MSHVACANLASADMGRMHLLPEPLSTPAAPAHRRCHGQKHLSLLIPDRQLSRKNVQESHLRVATLDYYVAIPRHQLVVRFQFRSVRFGFCTTQC